VIASPDTNECGILYIATGQKYARAALRSAASVARVADGLPCHLFTDEVGLRLAEALSLPNTTSGLIESPHRRSKIDYLKASPFEKTLYLDSDTLVVGEIRDTFTLLDRFDLALAHAHARNRMATNARWRTGVPRSFPQFNGGVIAYRKCGNVEEFLDAWQHAYHTAGFRKDQVTLRELLWESELAIATLPPEYNIRYVRQLIAWRRKEAVPRVLHLAALHGGAVANAWAKIVARYARWKFGTVEASIASAPTQADKPPASPETLGTHAAQSG